MRFVMFSKMLQEYPVAEAAGVIRSMGIEGVDLTVRPGGHVLPDRVEMALPEAVKAIRDQGLTVPMITTAITSADDGRSESVVAAAVHEDIRLLKLGYWNTQPGEVAASIDGARKALDGLERLARKYHITFGVHNHSGPSYVNCQPAILWTLLKDRDPSHIAAYFDPGHACVEGGDGGWRQGFALLAPHLRMVACKDFAWESTPEEPKRVWRHRQVPLRDGIVPWPEFIRGLTAMGYTGPVSLHSEYQGSHSWRDLTTPELIEQTAADLTFLRSLLARAD